jgi:hypothetical protein
MVMIQCVRILMFVLLVSLGSFGCQQEASENALVENVQAPHSLSEPLTEVHKHIEQLVDLNEFIGRTVANLETELSLTRTAPCLTKFVYWRSSCGVSAWTSPKLKNQILEIHWMRSTAGPVVRHLELIHVEK